MAMIITIRRGVRHLMVSRGDVYPSQPSMSSCYIWIRKKIKMAKPGFVDEIGWKLGQ